MPIVPDSKNWTWVLERPCPECGFDAASIDRDAMGSLLRENAAMWVSILQEPEDPLRRRATDDRWSPLEYACHVRDVFVLFQQRLHLMLTEDDPSYPNWDQDETAVAGRYNEQDPTAVSSELQSAADVLAAQFDGVTGSQWRRRGFRSDGASFDVEGFGRYLMHDPVHHLNDVEQDLPLPG